MKKTFALTLALALLTACDTPDAPTCVDFRQAPEVLYLSQYEADITANYFAAIVQACPSSANLALTFTRYPKDADNPLQVIGLGFSAMADDEWADCYEAIMLKLGAHP